MNKATSGAKKKEARAEIEKKEATAQVSRGEIGIPRPMLESQKLAYLIETLQAAGKRSEADEIIDTYHKVKVTLDKVADTSDLLKDMSEKTRVMMATDTTISQVEKKLNWKLKGDKWVKKE